ncbi:MAG: hypothetical protein KGI79_01050 [Patescibacteria group bacterium]|nr:hypothetical protein [Patescibacteria group bacterium]MDE2116444.1 hypothetical protein [Patescibacteria group bacterium]
MHIDIPFKAVAIGELFECKHGKVPFTGSKIYPRCEWIQTSYGGLAEAVEVNATVPTGFVSVSPETVVTVNRTNEQIRHPPRPGEEYLVYDRRLAMEYIRGDHDDELLEP